MEIHCHFQFMQSRWSKCVIFIIKSRGLWVCGCGVTELKLDWIRTDEEGTFFFNHLWIPAVRRAWEQPVRDREVMDETRKPKTNERRTKQQVGVRNKQTLRLVLHPPAPTAVLYQLLTERASVYRLVKVYWGDSFKGCGFTSDCFQQMYKKKTLRINKKLWSPTITTLWLKAMWLR